MARQPHIAWIKNGKISRARQRKVKMKRKWNSYRWGKPYSSNWGRGKFNKKKRSETTTMRWNNFVFFSHDNRHTRFSYELLAYVTSFYMARPRIFCCVCVRVNEAIGLFLFTTGCRENPVLCCTPRACIYFTSSRVFILFSYSSIR